MCDYRYMYSPGGILGAYIFDLRKHKLQSDKLGFECENLRRGVAIGLNESFDLPGEFCKSGYASRKSDEFRHLDVLSGERWQGTLYTRNMYPVSCDEDDSDTSLRVREVLMTELDVLAMSTAQGCVAMELTAKPPPPRMRPPMENGCAFVLCA
jgi:hypothetical protein